VALKYVSASRYYRIYSDREVNARTPEEANNVDKHESQLMGHKSKVDDLCGHEHSPRITR
jgi:hypothetical protein